MTTKLTQKHRAAPSFVVPLGGQPPLFGGVGALITLAGLLLLLSSPAIAAPAPEPVASEPARTVQAPPQPQRLAWQRVGAPISLDA